MSPNVSPKGRKFIYGHEGVVLKAYRDVVGVWTIGPGLTAASGVITPKAGMTITSQKCDELFDLAVGRNYLPRVVKALGANVSPFAIDAGVSFDWNTGAIHKASWVKSFLAGKKDEARQRLGLWNKAGGKVLRGLTRRRAEEANILLLGKYPADIESVSLPTTSETSLFAVFVVSATTPEIEEVGASLTSIGFDAGVVTGKILRSAVEGFQKAYNLTVDGRIGRATLSTLQRELDARRKAKSGAVTTAASTTVAAGDQAVSTVTTPAPADPTSVVPDHLASWIGGGIAVIAVAYLAWQAYQYRDIIAVRVADKAPRLANWLRSF
ncbi:peptidoglycan-binding protein [Agrobacterium sp. O3.4]|uniref:Lysozyme n=1 Tax=Agrobacterium cucumeris TaxID=2862866 RepID=A0ABY8RT71_9HYPH|nr:MULTISPECIES: peptidoglycan-binding protein [Rhizobium/Agrobacterium group]MCZ7469039.1 peptidoglycan-binding protein [Rhizobium rhizogenes]WHO10264.1 peptidoglycan-binding protein [Agrobacterium cucumeris]